MKKEIKIKTEYIKLDQFVKYVGIVGIGGEAKYLITDGAVEVNGEIEHRRGRKLRINDVVKYKNNEFVII